MEKQIRNDQKQPVFGKTLYLKKHDFGVIFVVVKTVV